MPRSTSHLLVIMALASGVLSAQDGDAAAADRVRRNNEAVESFKKGDYATAVDLLQALVDEEQRAGRAVDPVMSGNLVRSLVGRAGQELKRGENETARKTLIRARRLDDEEPLVHAWLGVVAWEAGLVAAAMDHVHDALSRDPDCVVALEYRGLLLYRQEELDPALADWRRCIQLEPARAATLEPMIRKVEAELAVEASMQSEKSSHFVCKFSDQQSRQIANKVLDWLEDAYSELGASFHQYPDRLLTVILYSDRDFGQVTGTHRWIGGLFDGKIRIPVRDFDRRKVDVRSTLQHEYMHFLIESMTKVCPAWLHEGLAQLAEGRKPREVALDLRAARNAGRLVPFADMARSFAAISDEKAVRQCYAQSLSFTGWLQAEHGAARLEEFLRAIRGGVSVSDVVLEVYKRSLEDLEAVWREAL